MPIGPRRRVASIEKAIYLINKSLCDYSRHRHAIQQKIPRLDRVKEFDAILRNRLTRSRSDVVKLLF